MSIIVEFENLVNAKQYDKALGFLLQNKEAFEPGVFFYNKGVLEARREDLVAARVSFEKSIKEGYLNNDLIKNLEMTKNNLGVDYLERSDDFESNILHTTLDLSIYTPIIFTSVLLIALITMLKNIKSAFILPVILVISSLPTVYYLYLKENYYKAVILEDAIIRRGPSEIFEEQQELPSGMLIILKKNESKWSHIVSPKSHRGWINNVEMDEL